MPKRSGMSIVLFLVFLGCQSSGSNVGHPDPLQNTPKLSAQEIGQGWKLLFDGKSLQGWKGFKNSQVPGCWTVTPAGELHMNTKGKGDIVTRDAFADFELSLEWRISEGGNSGIFYRASEDVERIWHAAAEVQVLDNAKHKDGKNPLTAAGSDYAMHAPAADLTRPVGEYNETRIIAVGNHVEHWLNGQKIVEYTIGSEDWLARQAASKFAPYPRYGRNANGHIVLQDHGDKVWFRNIKIRPLESEVKS